MTQVGRLFEEEKIEYAKEKVSEKSQEIAKSLLEDKVNIKAIMKYTGLSKEDIVKIKESLASTQT